MTNSPETETTMTLLMSVQRNMDGVWSPTSHCGAKKHLLASVDGSGLSTYSSVGTVSSLNIQSPLRLNYTLCIPLSSPRQHSTHIQEIERVMDVNYTVQMRDTY